MILLQLFKVLCVCNTRVGQIRAGQIRVGQIRAHHCSEYTIADQPSIVLAAKVSFYPKYPRSYYAHYDCTLRSGYMGLVYKACKHSDKNSYLLG